MRKGSHSRQIGRAYFCHYNIGMKHLVTGGAGFLGSLMARRLVERGEAVAIADLYDDANRHEDVEWLECDILNPTRVFQAMKDVDVVHHSAALVPLTRDAASFDRVNVEGSKIVAEAAARAGVKYFVHMSSSAVFGVPESCPIRPDTRPCPFEPYGKSKLAGENAVIEICQKNNLPYIVIRPRTIVGPTRLGIFEILFRWIKESRNVYVIGNGDIPLQFLHPDDLVDACLLLLDQKRQGAFNVGAAEFGTLRQALETLISHAGSKSQVVGLPVKPTVAILDALHRMRLSPLTPWHYHTYHRPFVFDLTPLLQSGWKPQYSNDAMLQQSYDWFNGGNKAANESASLSPHRNPVKEGILDLVRRMS